MPTEKESKKVAFVGSAGSSKDLAPWTDRSIEIWGLAWRKLRRCDRYFDIHPVVPHRKNLPPDYAGWMRDVDKPIYLQKAHPDVPKSRPYPLAAVVKTLSSVDENANGAYFVSSISYMLGLAIHEKYDEIQLFGIDLLCNDEYVHQRPNAEYLIGLARGLGIKVLIPPSSAICKYSHLYGYENHPGFGVFEPHEIRARLREYEDKREKAMLALYTVDGAIQESTQLLQLAENFDRGLGVDKTEGYKNAEINSSTT